MASDESRPHRRKRPALLALILAALLLLVAFLLRNCLGIGLGTDEREDSAEHTQPPSSATSSDDAGASTPHRDAGAGLAVCVVEVDAQGIRVDGKPASIEEAVRRCSAAGRVNMVVRGDARTGTYNDLVRALRDAGVVGVPPPEEL